MQRHRMRRREIDQLAREKEERKRAETNAVTESNLRACGLLPSHGNPHVPFGSAVDWHDVFHSFEEFENAPPLSFAIQGFLQNDAATMVGGLSDHGKTLILCSITKALLAGKGTRLWDLFDVVEDAVRVIYLIPECSISPFKHRLKLFGLYKFLAPNDERLLVRTLSKGTPPYLDDPRILYAAKGAHVILDTAVRFADGDLNAAIDNQRGLASDIFELLAAGARTVIAAHHSPKSFERERRMTLENVLSGSGDIGAMLSTAWGVRQIDKQQNILHVENVKPRDFEPCGPFQIIGRPHIDQEGDFRLHKAPEECGYLADELPDDRNAGGAPPAKREEKQRRVEIVRAWLREDPSQTAEQLRTRFSKEHKVQIAAVTMRKYRQEACRDDTNSPPAEGFGVLHT